jgi:hypothetical protein
MESYLGDYAARQTLGTFSLLPGEKTVIEIRDYRHNETTPATSRSSTATRETAMEDLQTGPSRPGIAPGRSRCGWPRARTHGPSG